MNEYHQIHGRSLRVGCNGRPRGPDSTDLDSLPAPEEPGLGAAGSRAPPPPSRQKVRAGARDFRAEGLGRPAHPPALRGGGACWSGAATARVPDLPRCGGGREVSGVKA